MLFEYQSAPGKQTAFFTPISCLLILGLLFAIAFGIRLYYIDSDMKFHPSRQYRSAIITRVYYFERSQAVPEWRRDVAILNKQREGIWEPPLLEFISSIASKSIGEEQIWIPRLLSSIFWLVGGGFLFALAKKLISSDAAVLCTAFYLFVPFGIRASRSFQPDPLMAAALLISTFTIVWYYDKRSTLRLIIAAIVTVLSISIKFVGLFSILGVFVFVGIYIEGFRTFVKDIRHIIFFLVSLLPATIFYSYGLFIGESLTHVAQLDIMPHLLIQPFF